MRGLDVTVPKLRRHFLCRLLCLGFLRFDFLRRAKLDVEPLANRHILVQRGTVLRAVDAQLVEKPPDRRTRRLHFPNGSAHFELNRHRADDMNLRVVLHANRRHAELVVGAHRDARLRDNFLRLRIRRRQLHFLAVGEYRDALDAARARRQQGRRRKSGANCHPAAAKRLSYLLKNIHPIPPNAQRPYNPPARPADRRMNRLW